MELPSQHERATVMSETSDFAMFCSCLFGFGAEKRDVCCLWCFIVSRGGGLCPEFTCACIDYYQGAAKVLIFPVVQQFTEAFVQALQMPDGPTSDSGFKMEVLKVSNLWQMK